MNGSKDPGIFFSRVDKIPRKEKEERYGQTTLISKDLVCLDGKGSRITVLYKGIKRTLIDASSGVSVKNLGYGNEGVGRVIKVLMHNQKDLTLYPHHDMENDYALDLAWLLTELTPLKGEKEVIFANSGTEAVELAIKLCLQARRRSTNPLDRRRKDFIATYGAFHGRTLGSLSLTCSNPVQREGYPTNAFQIHHMPFPARHKYFVYEDDGDIQYYDYSSAEYVEYVKKACRQGKIDIDSVTAVCIELIQGEGGINVASKDAIQDLVKFFKDNGIYIVIDEIQTGLGRTGKLFAFEHFNIDPDVVLVSKSLAYGYPFSAAIYLKPMGFTEKGQQSSTFAGAPLGSVMAREVLRQLVCDNLPHRAYTLGEKILGPALREIEHAHQEVIHNVRGIGLMYGIEFWNPKTGKPATQFRYLVRDEAIKRGVLFLEAGISTLRIMPPLTISSDSENKRDNDLGKIIDVLEESIRAAKRKMKRIK